MINETRCDMIHLVMWSCRHQWPSHVTDGIINTITAFVRSRWLKGGLKRLFSHLKLLALASASCDANCIVNMVSVFICSRWLKQCATKLFWSYDGIGAGINLSWCKQYYQWYNSISKVKMIKWDAPWLFGHVMLLEPASASCDTNGIINGTTAFLWSKLLKCGAHYIFGHVMHLVLALSMEQLHLSIQDNQTEVQPNIMVMWCYWHQCWHCMIPILLVYISHCNTAL